MNFALLVPRGRGLAKTEIELLRGTVMGIICVTAGPAWHSSVWEMTLARRRGKIRKEVVPVLGLREWDMSNERKENNTKLKGRKHWKSEI